MKSTIQKIHDWTKFGGKFVKGAAVLLLAPSLYAQVTVFTNTWPIYEPFSEYTNASPFNLGAGQSATNWNFGNGTSSSQFKVSNSAAMTYPALKPDPTNANPSGVQEIPSGSNGSGDRGINFSARTDTIYTSFLLNYQDNGGMTEDRVAYQLARNAAPGSFSAVYTAIWLTPDYRLKVTKNYSEANSILTAKFSAATPVLTRNVPHLVVMRYARVPGNNDRVDLWVDPTSLGDNANIPAATISTTNAVNVANFNGVLLNHRKVNGQSGNTFSVFQVDEMRLGSAWSDVTPLATPAPGPTFTVTGGGVGCPGDSFAVNLSGSVATNDYLLYTNAAYAGITLTGNGSALNFGSFSAAATFSILASNNVNGNIGWMSNTASVYVRAAISIVTQPAPAITVTNSRAQFTVGVVGDEIAYHWYKTGNPTPLADDAHLTGSQSSSLVIWPAVAADIGSYYCVVTNACTGVSGVTSSSASLTLGAPANLVWAGTVFSTLPYGGAWDIATSANWTGGSGVFNEGDNVTFDDTYNGASYGAILPLVGTLTPTHTTYNTAQQLILGGNGSLAGSGDLLVSGPGRLVISNTAGAGIYLANPYTGGTVISNGVVFVQAVNALGSGPITLAGGALETLGKLAFTNDVNVTANSIVQLDQTGNQSITLLGGFNCSPGVAIVFTNSATTTNSPNWVVLSAAFTNNAAMILSVNANATNSTQSLNCNISTNSQTFNGVISELTFPGPTGTAGGGGLVKQGAGAVYLNAANTYTFLTTNMAGFLAGSGSINSRLGVAAGATLGAGSAANIGTFTVNSNITLNGNLFIRANKSLAQSNDTIVATGTITNGGTGTLTITNIGASPIVAGDKFKIFSGAVSNGAALTIVDGNIVVWANNLAVDGTIQAVSVIPNYATNISGSVSGNVLTISWPASHLGWILQSQTNSLATGIKTNNWFDVAGTASGVSNGVTLNPANPSVFYRLRHP